MVRYGGSVYGEHVHLWFKKRRKKGKKARITNGSEEVEFDILAIDLERGGTAGHGREVPGCRKGQDGF